MNFRARLRKIRLPRLPQLIERVLANFAYNDGATLAAGIAYYGFVTIFPLILALIGITGLVLPSRQVQDQIFNFAAANIPWAAEFVQTNIESTIRLRGELGFIGLAGLIIAGSGLFGTIGHAINRAWDIERELPVYWKWAMDIGLTLGLGLLLMISIGATALIAVPKDFLPVPGVSAGILSNLFGFLISFANFLLMFKFLPNTKTYWRHIWFAALVSAAAFQAGQVVLLVYFTSFARYDLIYGPVASTIALLAWMYYSSFVLIFGAELAAEYGRMRRGIPRSLHSHSTAQPPGA